MYRKRDLESISIDNNPADSPGSKALSDAVLGKDAKTYSVVVGHNTSQGQKRRSQRHRLTGFAQHLLIENDVRSKRSGARHRTRHCHAARHFMAEKIELALNADESESEASLRGLQTCDSVWACPVCAARIAAARGNEIKRALNWAADNGYIAVMMTMTARHNKSMPLQPFKDAFKRAYKYFREGRAGAALWKSYGIAHTIKGVEVLRNPVNGWHYHQHVLLFVPRESFAGREVDLQTDARARWLKALKREGLEGIGEYALTITAHHQTPETYLAKMGISPESTAKLDYELAGGMNKSASKGVNVWTLLQRAQRGDNDAIALYLEYVQAMDGEKWLVWSDGFKALVGLDELADDELTDESEPQAVFMTISDDDYAAVRHYHAQADLLDIAAASRKELSVRAFLEGLAQDWTDDLLAAAPAAAPPASNFEVYNSMKLIGRKLAMLRANLNFARRHVADKQLQARYVASYEDEIDDLKGEFTALQLAVQGDLGNL